jgi:hypothetical protein
MLSRMLVLAAAAFIAGSCGAPGPEPVLPGFEQLASQDAAATRVGPQRPPAAAQPTGALTATNDGPGSPIVPNDPEARRTGRAILDCDTHLRTWSNLMAQPRDEENLEKIGALSIALGMVVAKNRAILEAQAMSGSPRNRGIASAALGFSGDPSVLPYLVNNTADADPIVAAKALLGLGVLAAPETPIAPVYDAIAGGAAPQGVISNAAFALFQIAIKTKTDPDGGMAAAFVLLLQNPDPMVRAQAALGLGLVRANQILPELTDLLAADPEPTVRTAAAYALGQIGARNSTAPLVRALSDPDDVTAGTARASLKRIHGKDFGPDAASWRTVEAR